MSHIPVLLLTALGDEKNMLEGLKTGADAYIIKPFSVGILKATVKNILAPINSTGEDCYLHDLEHISAPSGL